MVKQLSQNITEREKETLYCICLGETTSDIAASLEVSPETIKTYVRNLRGKLHATTRAQIVFNALAGDYISVSEVALYAAKR